MHAELDTKWTSHSGRKFSMWPPNYPITIHALHWYCSRVNWFHGLRVVSWEFSWHPKPRVRN